MSTSTEQANAAVIYLTATPPSAKAYAKSSKCANPAIFTIGGFQIMAAKFEDGTVRIEVAEGTYNIGGVAEFNEAVGPITFEKFVKYGDEDGDRILRVCETKGETGGCADDDCTNIKAIHIVIGRTADTVDGVPVFSRIKTSIECDHLCDAKLVEVYTRITHIKKQRKLSRSVAMRMSSLPPELMARLAETAQASARRTAASRGATPSEEPSGLTGLREMLRRMHSSE
jgi:hypothetical protein